MMLDPLFVSGGRAAEEDQIEVFELVIGDRQNDSRLVADLGQRAGRFAGAVEQRYFREWKCPLAKNGRDLVADKRERIDDTHAITRVRLHGTCVASSKSSASGGGAVREGNAIDHNRSSGPEPR